MKTVRPALALALFWILCLSLAWSQAPREELPMVDYRMSPLEQVKKVHRMARGDGPTMTVMNLRTKVTGGDYDHLIVNTNESSAPDNLPGKMVHFDAVSWQGGGAEESSACDSRAECETRTDDMCDAAGHDGVISVTVEITHHADGSKTCSGDCQSGTAIAFVTCGGGSQCVLCN